MSNILVVSGHPHTDDDSAVNRTILEKLAVLLPGAEIDHLDDPYLEYTLDVEAEQEKLRVTDVIVLQYPLWWYGWPALLQKRMEDVSVHGFDRESSGTALCSKELVVPVTMGASQIYYAPDFADSNDLLTPAGATCALTGIGFAESLPLYGVSYASRTDEAAHADIVGRLYKHVKHLMEFVSSL